MNVTGGRDPERTMMGLGRRLNEYPATEGEEDGVGGVISRSEREERDGGWCWTEVRRMVEEDKREGTRKEES